MTTNVIEHDRHFILWQLLHQPKQFLPLHAHALSVRKLIPRTRVPVACPIGR
jgi:hypothetical protein